MKIEIISKVDAEMDGITWQQLQLRINDGEPVGYALYADDSEGLAPTLRAMLAVGELELTTP